ncbi:MAG: hypothetical protein ACJ71Z_11795 [Aeromicrobium sp.]
MFGKGKQEHKHRFVDDKQDESIDPELEAALKELGRREPLPAREADAPTTEIPAVDGERVPVEAEAAQKNAPQEKDTEPADEAAGSIGDVAAYAALKRERRKAAGRDVALAEAQARVEALSAEVEKLRVASAQVGQPDAGAPDGLQAALAESQTKVESLTAELDRVRSKSSASSVARLQAAAEIHTASGRVDELQRALTESQARANSLTADLKQMSAASNARIESLAAELDRLRSQSSAASEAEGQAAAESEASAARATDLHESLARARGRVDALKSELERVRADAKSRVDAAAAEAEEARGKAQERVDAVTAELDRLRSDSAAASVALERASREAAEREAALADAERRLDETVSELEKIRSASATAPAQVERLRREAEREMSMRAALDQAQASAAQAESLTEDNLRLSSELAANLQSQSAVMPELAALRTELAEQRAWLQDQIDRLRAAEEAQNAIADELQQAIVDRDSELEALRAQLLDAEIKRAEEATAFIASLDR